jgi:hypothetical protein
MNNSMKTKIAFISNIVLLLCSFVMLGVDGLPTLFIPIIFVFSILIAPIINLHNLLNIKNSSFKLKKTEKRILIISNILMLVFWGLGIITGGVTQSFWMWLFIFVLLFTPIINLSLLNYWEKPIKYFSYYKQSLVMFCKSSMFIIKTKKIILNNKILISVILFSIIFVYLWGIRPIQIRKQCSVVVKYSNWSGSYEADASEAEYQSCLRKNGLEVTKPLSQEIRDNKAYCYKWYGKACDDPNFNPE